MEKLIELWLEVKVIEMVIGVGFIGLILLSFIVGGVYHLFAGGMVSWKRKKKIKSHVSTRI
jgi:uncharacterized membrane protein (DUF485 family)